MGLDEHLRVELRRQGGELASGRTTLHQRVIARVRKPHRVAHLVSERHHHACAVNACRVGIQRFVEHDARVIPGHPRLASNYRTVDWRKLHRHCLRVAVVHILDAEQSSGLVDPSIHRLFEVRAVRGGVVDLQRVSADIAVVEAEEVPVDVGNLFALFHLSDRGHAPRITRVSNLPFVRIRRRCTN